MQKILRYSFCTISLSPNYLICVMNEGEHISPNINQVLENIAKTYYKGKPFVYISHRVHSYSVDPSIYFKTSKIENLIGFAIASKIPISISNAKVERLFLKKPFEAFTTIEDAINWAKCIISKDIEN